MASRADVEASRAALQRIVDMAETDLRGFLATLPASDRIALTNVMQEGWLMILGKYAGIAEVLGGDWFEVMARELGVRPILVLRQLRGDYALRRMEEALAKPDQVANLILVLDELVKSTFRRTIQDSAHASGGAYARVPKGAETCAFCLMLASRGAVYKSRKTAGDKKVTGAYDTYHGKCDCAVVFVRGPEDYPEGYDPEALYDKYAAARDLADSTSASDVLPILRHLQGIR